MKKRFFISALLIFAVIFGNMTVFAADDYYYDYDYSYEDPSLDNPYKYYYKELRSFLEGEYYLDETVYYRDESGRFTKEERQKIIDLLKDTSKKIGFNLAVYTGGYMRSDNVTQLSASNGSETIFKNSAENNTVFLYVDLDGYSNAYDYMDCYREPCLYYFATSETEDDKVTRIDKILEKMQEKFPAGGSQIYFSDIYDGLKVYCEQLIYYKELGPEENAYYYNSDIGKYICFSGGKRYESDSLPRPFKHRILFIFLAILGGSLTAVIVYFSINEAYKFKRSASASVYTSANQTFITNKVDQFLGSNVTKVRIESSSSHHSGGSSHHSGGGHSGHSGGGRHR